MAILYSQLLSNGYLVIFYTSLRRRVDINCMWCVYSIMRFSSESVAMLVHHWWNHFFNGQLYVIGFWWKRGLETAALFRVSCLDIDSSGTLNSKRSSCFLKSSTLTPWRFFRCFGQALNSCGSLYFKLLLYMVLTGPF